MSQLKRTAEGGFITIMALLIMTALFSLSIGYVSVTMNEGRMVDMLKKGDQAREAALAGTRLAAGALIKDRVTDAGTPYDWLGEDWFNLTNRTTDGSIEPFPLDAARGIYFMVTVIDLDGRVRFNTASPSALSLSAASILGALPDYTTGICTSGGSTCGGNLIANNYMTLMEPGRAYDLGNEKMTYLSPYGEGTDMKVNLNTVDPLENFGSGDSPDVLNSVIARLMSPASGSAATVVACGGTINGASSYSASNYAVAIIRYRRGAALAQTMAGTALTQDDAMTGVGTGHGGTYATTYDDPHAEFGPSLRNTNSITIPAGASRTGEFCRVAATSTCTLQPRRAYGICATWTKEANTSGVFLIRSKGWVLKNPTDADKVGGDKAAAYQVLHIIQRNNTAPYTGYDDCFHREWWQDRQDMYSGATSGYDWENTIYVYDKDKT